MEPAVPGVKDQHCVVGTALAVRETRPTHPEGMARLFASSRGAREVVFKSIFKVASRAVAICCCGGERAAATADAEALASSAWGASPEPPLRTMKRNRRRSMKKNYMNCIVVAG